MINILVGLLTQTINFIRFLFFAKMSTTVPMYAYAPFSQNLTYFLHTPCTGYLSQNIQFLVQNIS